MSRKTTEKESAENMTQTTEKLSSKKKCPCCCFPALLCLLVFLFGIILLWNAFEFLEAGNWNFSAQLDGFLAASAERGKDIPAIVDLASGLRLKAALIPAVSGLILILASLIAALRVHKKSASQLEYYQRCLEEDKRVLLSAELLEKFEKNPDEFDAKNEALMKIIESQMELNKRDMGPSDED